MSELLNKIKLNRSTNSINTKYAFIIKNPKSKNVLRKKVRSIYKNNKQKEFEFCLLYSNFEPRLGQISDARYNDSFLK